VAVAVARPFHERRISADRRHRSDPVAEIIAMKDTLRLSALQMIGSRLGIHAGEELQIYKNIRTLLAKSQEVGDMTQMRQCAMMLEEASANTRSVGAALKLLRPAVADPSSGHPGWTGTGTRDRQR